MFLINLILQNIAHSALLRILQFVIMPRVSNSISIAYTKNCLYSFNNVKEILRCLAQEFILKKSNHLLRDQNLNKIFNSNYFFTFALKFLFFMLRFHCVEK